MIRYILFSCLLCASPAALFAQQQVDPQQREAGERETLSKPVELPPAVGLYKDLQNVPDDIRRSAPFARALYEMTRRAGLDGTFDREERYQAFQQSRQDLMQASVAEKASGQGAPMKPLADAWTNIGLNGSPNNNVFSSGCISAIAINPSNTSIVYVGGTSGGVWKSTDQGGHWVPLTDLALPNLSVASIALDPKHPNTLYVGTGNGYASLDELTGTGLYKSTDGGGTWNRIGAASLTATVVKVLVDPVHSNIVFAAQYSGSRGLYRSTDSGATWTRVFASAGVVWDVLGTVVGGTPYLYFAEGNNINSSLSQECGIYKSVDDGATWSKNAAQFPRGDTIGRCALAASIADPRRVFALLSNPIGDIISNGNRSLFRTTDGGLSWVAIPMPTTVFHGGTGGPIQVAQGWYDCVLGVTPYSNGNSGSDTIYVGGVEAWVNCNDGQGWQDYSDNSWNWIYTHVDHHSIAFDPLDPQIVYDGNDGGLYWSNNAGLPGQWGYRSNLMVTGRFYHIGLDRLSSNYVTTLGGAQDQGTWKIQGSTPPVFELGGDGLQPIVNSSNSTYPYYGELPAGDLYRYNNSSHVWQQIDTESTDAADWNTPFKQSIAPYLGIPAYHVFYAGRNHLWRSTDDGSTWRKTSDSVFSNNIHALGLSALTSNNIYEGSFGEIQLSTDAGSSWTSKSASLPSAWVTSIVTTGQDDQFALASFGTSGANHVMRTTDMGAHWFSKNGGTGHTLPAVGVNCVAVDSVDPLRIWYAGTDNGIYYTIDSGLTWSVAGSGMGLVPCYDVQVQANKTTIRVASFGRGIWEGSTNALPVELSSLAYRKTQSGTVLSWHTDSERGDAGFFVERSLNGAAFEDINPQIIQSKSAGGTSNSRLDYNFLDTLKAAGTYLYQLKQVDLDGSIHFSNHVEVHWGGSQMTVYQNYPNPLMIGTPTSVIAGGFQPFGPDNTQVVQPAPATRIDYELPFDETTDGDAVSVKIYNSLGKFVGYAVDPNGVAVNNLTQPAGTNSAFWDGHASDGAIAPSGAYFYTIETQHFGSYVGKMVLYSN